GSMPAKRPASWPMAAVPGRSMAACSAMVLALASAPCRLRLAWAATARILATPMRPPAPATTTFRAAMVISPLGHAYSSALPKRQQPCPIAVTMLGFVEPRSRKTDLAITNALAGIAVEDITEAIDFYQTLFGRPADARPM